MKPGGNNGRRKGNEAYVKNGRKHGIEAFNQAPEEKRQRVRRAVMAEFAEHGFANASTNRIACNAAIGKGMIFHYFGSKEGLFLYFFKDALEQYNHYYEQWVENLPGELFSRALAWAEKKFEFYGKHPLVADFLVHSYLKSTGEVRRKLEEIHKADYRRKMQDFIRGIDTRYLREGIDTEKALEVFFAVLEQMEQALIDRYYRPDKAFPLDELKTEMKQYLDILEYGLYTRTDV